MKKCEALVSIIVPVYNGAKYLRRCLDSLLAQTYSNIQIIVIDDGSTDNTWDICEEYSNKYNVDAISQENQGVSSARNRGLECAKGQYIMFCDSDDYALPQIVETLVRNAESTKSDLSCCSMFVANNNGEFEQRDMSDEVQCITGDSRIMHILTNLRCRGYVWNKLFHRDIIEAAPSIRFKENIAILEDEIFVLEYLMRSTSMCFVDECLYVYCYNDSSATNGSLSEARLTVLLAREEIFRIVNTKDVDYHVREIAWNQLMRNYAYIFKDLFLVNYKNKKYWLKRIKEGYQKHFGLYRYDQEWTWKYKSYIVAIAIYCKMSK